MACRWEGGGGPGRRRGGGRAQNEENARGAFSGLMIDDNPLRVFCVSRISFLWIFFNLGARLFSFFSSFLSFFFPSFACVHTRRTEILADKMASHAGRVATQSRLHRERARDNRSSRSGGGSIHCVNLS